MDHLIGTKTVKPYMHGYFIPLKLYDAARVVHNPFAYEEHRENLVKEKVEKLVESRIRSKKVDLPKVNRALAERLQREYEKKQSVLAKRAREVEDEEKGKQKEVEVEVAEENVLRDPRFKEMFTNPDFEVDPESREYELLRPGAARSKRAEVCVLQFLDMPLLISVTASCQDGGGARGRGKRSIFLRWPWNVIVIFFCCIKFQIDRGRQ